MAQAQRKTTPAEKSQRLEQFQESLRNGNASLEPNLSAARRYQSVRDIKKHFAGHLIRRTITSILSDGQPISVLPAKHVHSLPIKLSEVEMNIINDTMEASTEESKKKKRSFNFSLNVSLRLLLGTVIAHTDFSPQDFLSKCRMAVANPYWFYPSKKTDKQIPRTYPSKVEYDRLMADAPATKLKTLIELLKYHLSDDNVPPVTVDPITRTLVYGDRSRQHGACLY